MNQAIRFISFCIFLIILFLVLGVGLVVSILTGPISILALYPLLIATSLAAGAYYTVNVYF